MKGKFTLTILVLLIVPMFLFAQHEGCPFSGDKAGKGEKQMGMKAGGMMMNKGPAKNHDCPMGSREMGGNLTEELGLTDNQIEQLSNMKLEHKKETAELHTQKQIIQMEIDQLWNETTPDKKKIMEKTRERERIDSQLSEKKVEHRINQRNILTEDQKGKLKQLNLRKHNRNMKGF